MAVRRMLVAGRYRLHEPVGTGGMGRVWVARDEMLDRDVAVKEFVPPDWMTDEEKDRLRDRTLREARSAARLNHPHVVRIYDVVHAEGLPWIVMEYIPSRSLYQVISEDGPFTPGSAAKIGLDVLSALTAAHRAGVLHRDVKPHNVLIGHDGRVVLTDFGLATFVDDGSVTGPGLVVGSPQYVSPERARDGASTVESDMWSFGATLYAAVEGRSPYFRDNAMATLTALATEKPDPPVLSGSLTPVLTGLLRHEPEERLTAREVEQKLREIVSGGVPRVTNAGKRANGRAVVPQQRKPTSEPVLPPAAPPATAPPAEESRPHKSRFVTAVVLAIVLLAGAGIATGIWLQRDRDPDPQVIAGPTAPSSAPPASGTGASGFTSVVCDRKPPAGLPRTPQPGASRENPKDGYGLLAGYSIYADAEGEFRLAVPDGWSYQRVGTTVCFRDPGNTRVMSLDFGRNPDGDPVKACIVERDRLLEDGALPGYRELGITLQPLAIRAAEWEYTYQPSAVRMHSATRWFVNSGRAFALGWTTTDFDWTQNLSSYRMIQSTFTGTV